MYLTTKGEERFSKVSERRKTRKDKVQFLIFTYIKAFPTEGEEDLYYSILSRQGNLDQMIEVRDYINQMFTLKFISDREESNE